MSTQKFEIREVLLPVYPVLETLNKLTIELKAKYGESLDAILLSEKNYRKKIVLKRDHVDIKLPITVTLLLNYPWLNDLIPTSENFDNLIKEIGEYSEKYNIVIWPEQTDKFIQKGCNTTTSCYPKPILYASQSLKEKIE